MPIQILVPTLGAQHFPGRVPSHVLASGTHCIQGTAALIIVMIFSDMMMNQRKALVMPSESLRRVTAKAILVHPMEVRVNVARALMMIINLDRLSISRSQLWRPSPHSMTR